MATNRATLCDLYLFRLFLIMRCQRTRVIVVEDQANVKEPGAAEIDVRPVRTLGERHRFVEFPYQLYRGDAHWIAPLRMAQKDILNTKRHPFYKTSDVEMFLARRDGRVVGRIMAILNRAHNEFHNERAGFFGFFEVENDEQAAGALLGAARDWVLGRGAAVIEHQQLHGDPFGIKPVADGVGAQRGQQQVS